MKLTLRCNKLLVLSAAAAFSAGPLLAQMQNGAGAQSMPGTPSAQQPTQQQPGQAADPATGMTSNGAASFADQAFVRQVMESDAAQVQMGQLAQQKSQSDDVKKLGQSMAMNRTRLDEQLKPIANQMAVDKPKGPSKKDKQTIAKLEALSGPQFDQEYLQTVAKANEKDVKDFKAEADAAQDPNLKQAATQDAAVLAQHQTGIEKIAQTHNVTLDAKK